MAMSVRAGRILHFYNSNHSVSASRRNFLPFFLFTFLFVFPLLGVFTQKIAHAQVEVIEYNYDQGTNGVGRLSSVIEKKGTTETGRTTFFYDARGNVTATDRVIAGSPSGHYLTQSTYDSLDRPIDLTYPDGEVVRHSYNNQGLLDKLRSVTYSIDYVPNLDYNAPGKVTAKTIGNGATTKTTAYDYYDNAAKGPVSLRLRNINTPGLQDLTYIYDNVGNVLTINDTIKGSTQTFGYDNLHRLITAASPNSPTYNHTYYYNAIGNMLSASYIQARPPGSVGFTKQTVESAGSAGWFTSLALDNAGTPHISYQGGDFANPVLKYARWTGSGWDIKPAVDNGGWYTSLALDSAGNPHISYLDGSNRLKYAKWIGSSWELKPIADNAGSGITSIALDIQGNPHISYTAQDGLKYARWTGSAWDIKTVESGFGLNNSFIRLDDSGNAHISYSGSSLKYARWTGSTWDIQIVDNRSNLRNPSLVLGAAGKPYISYHDANLNRLMYAEKLGSAWNISVIESNVAGYPSLALDNAGAPHISYYNTPSLGVGSLKYARWIGSGWDIQVVDPGGDVGTYTSLALDSGGIVHISYQDFANRDLKYATASTSVPDTGSLSFTYPQVIGASRPHGPNSDGNGNYTYDANGNMTMKATGAVTRIFTWDAGNHLIKVAENGVTLAEFTYDYAGNRVTKKVTSLSGITTTTFYISDLYECVTTTCTKYYFANSQRVASKPVGSNDANFYFGDHLGSTNVVANAAFTETQGLLYYPYGQTRQNSIAPSSGFDYKFTDQELDDETGLYYYGARYYDPALMHFISADTIKPNTENPQTLNRYSYALNNPLKFNDPSGHYTCNVIDDGTTDCVYESQERADDYWEGTSYYLSEGDIPMAVLSFFGAVASEIDLGLATIQQMVHEPGNALIRGKNELAKGNYLEAAKEGLNLTKSIAILGLTLSGPASMEAETSLTAGQLRMVREAKSLFTPDGRLTPEAIANSHEIIPATKLINPAIPKGFSKWTTKTYPSPSGDFQIHFYRNSTSGEVFYGLDYKAVPSHTSGSFGQK